jgi:hypothetical protein
VPPPPLQKKKQVRKSEKIKLALPFPFKNFFKKQKMKKTQAPFPLRE